MKIIKFKILLIVILLSSSFCFAASTVEDPKGLVQQVLDHVMAIQTNPTLQGSAHRYQRALEIKKIITNNFDARRMAKESLKGYWKKLNPSKKEKFTEVFSDLFQDSYTRLVLNFLKKETIEYLENTRNDKNALVKTAIVRANDKINVDYSLKLVKKKWLITDVSIDGVSIVENYRSMFTREIVRNSFTSLLKKMEIQQRAIKMKLTENSER